MKKHDHNLRLHNAKKLSLHNILARGLSIALLLHIPVAFSQNKIELETLTITGNTELPKILYLIPWQDAKPSQDNQRKLKLHSISDGIFDIRMPTREKIDEIKAEKKALIN